MVCTTLPLILTTPIPISGQNVSKHLSLGSNGTKEFWTGYMQSYQNEIQQRNLLHTTVYCCAALSLIHLQEKHLYHLCQSICQTTQSTLINYQLTTVEHQFTLFTVFVFPSSLKLSFK